jgi:hypothetical protein
MAGSALAIGVQFPNLPIENHVKVANLDPNSPTLSTEMDVEIDNPGTYATTVSTSTNSLKASIVGLNGQNLESGSLVPVTGNINLPNAQTYTATLRIDGAANGRIKIHMIGPNEASTEDEVIVNVTTKIPEFPTVALPVVAILGLVFVFGRKKEGL